MTQPAQAASPTFQAPALVAGPKMSYWRSTAALYLMCFILSLMFATFAIVVVYTARPHADNTAIVTTIISFLAAGLPGLMAVIKGSENGQAIQEVHLSVNSRLDEFLRQASTLGQAQGREQARTEATPSTAIPAEVPPLPPLAADSALLPAPAPVPAPSPAPAPVFDDLVAKAVSDAVATRLGSA